MKNTRTIEVWVNTMKIERERHANERGVDPEHHLRHRRPHPVDAEAEQEHERRAARRSPAHFSGLTNSILPNAVSISPSRSFNAATVGIGRDRKHVGAERGEVR